MISKRILSDFLTLWTIYNNGTQKRQPHQTAFFVYFNMKFLQTPIIDKKTKKVHFCAPDDATPLFTWNSLEDMLISELTRLYCLFTEDGRRINKAKSTLPI